MLTVLHESGKDKYGKIMVYCRCDCGNNTEVLKRNVKNNKTKSCGCLAESTKIKPIHGYFGTPIYKVWDSMIYRCYNIHCASYHNYGGRGISVCNIWRHSPKAFIDWALSNGFSDGLQLDRIDNNAGYSPDNCRFVTPKENCRNKRNNVLVNFNGRLVCKKEYSEITGLSKAKVETLIKNKILSIATL